MSIDSCQTEGRQSIAFPQREREQKERSTLCTAKRSKIIGRIEDPREQKQMVFCTFGTHLVPFPQESSIIHVREDI